MNEITAERTGNPDMAKIIYILYMVGLLNGITILIGVIMAYAYRDDAPPWLRTHFDSQIRMFWISLVYWIVATILILAFIGFLLYGVIAIWWIVRSIKGFQHLDKKEPYPNYQSWAF